VKKIRKARTLGVVQVVSVLCDFGPSLLVSELVRQFR